MLMCIFCTFNAVFANVSADKTVTIKSENISVKEALNMVKKQTGINIMYEDATLNNVPLKLTLNKEPLEQALSVICSQAGMRYYRLTEMPNAERLPELSKMIRVNRSLELLLSSKVQLSVL